ncbi:hypothetical protein CEXT_430291 [Caerostris extrusa]|uniref:Uncharacterized protein n=1 Tax=Caerostris extrusa TaxID=172846 RepID=A0AAV4XWZ0_CAEEX|nr:hypothetical protein CEXT_430291 [Caerostris extrusa]
MGGPSVSAAPSGVDEAREPSSIKGCGRPLHPSTLPRDGHKFRSRDSRRSPSSPEGFASLFFVMEGGEGSGPASAVAVFKLAAPYVIKFYQRKGLMESFSYKFDIHSVCKLYYGPATCKVSR